MTTSEITSPASDAVFRTDFVREEADGYSKIVSVAHLVSVDGEWIDVHELIEAWRAR